jgi:DNA-binding response OmpR family regulator
MTHAVLVIEDEEVLAKNILVYLQRHDYEVTLAPSAEDGLALTAWKRWRASALLTPASVC